MAHGKEKQSMIMAQLSNIARTADKMGIDRTVPITLSEQIKAIRQKEKLAKTQEAKRKLLNDYMLLKPSYSVIGLSSARIQEMAQESKIWTAGYHSLRKSLAL